MPNRRQRMWLDRNVDRDITTNDTPVAEQLVPSGFLEELTGWTIIRLVVGVDLVPLVADATSLASQQNGFGIAMLSDEAVAGASAIPDPLVDSEVPPTGWMWRQSLLVRHLGTSTASMRRIDVDLRAMRKMGYARPQLILSSTGVEGPTFTTSIRGIIRMLVLRP